MITYLLIIQNSLAQLDSRHELMKISILLYTFIQNTGIAMKLCVSLAHTMMCLVFAYKGEIETNLFVLR